MLLRQAGETIKLVCPPKLSKPPPGTVAALEQIGRTDPSSAAWVVELDEHLENQKVCE